MADEPISTITEATSLDSADLIPIVDVSEGKTKRITKANAFSGLAETGGINGGQIYYGGINSGEDLRLHSNTSKDGVIGLGDTDQYDEATGELKVNYIQFRDYIAGGYKWTDWNPTDVAGTQTGAPATGSSLTATKYFTLNNSGGTLTITFTKAGRYKIDVSILHLHLEGYTMSRIIVTKGGTATRFGTSDSLQFWGIGAENSTGSNSDTFLITATASQTVTLAATFEIAGGSSTANHTASLMCSVEYIGG